MTILAAIGGLSFLLVCVVGGARLLILASRTHGLPELVLGTGLFLLGGVATPLGVIARLPDVSEEMASALILAQSLLMVIGMGGFALFTYRVFRRRVAWALALAVAIPLAMLAGVVGTLLDERAFSTAVVEVAGTTTFSSAAGLVALGWAGWESLLHASAIRRRLRLGMGDPIVFDRLRLWGVAMTLATLLNAFTIGASLAGIDLMATVGGAALVGTLGFVAASSIYLAFLPPASYLEWVRRREAVGT